MVQNRVVPSEQALGFGDAHGDRHERLRDRVHVSPNIRGPVVFNQGLALHVDRDAVHPARFALVADPTQSNSSATDPTFYSHHPTRLAARSDRATR